MASYCERGDGAVVCSGVAECVAPDKCGRWTVPPPTPGQERIGQPPTRILASPRKLMEDWRLRFGGGMIPFDSAYTKARREGATEADAQSKAFYAALETFVAELESPWGGAE